MEDNLAGAVLELEALPCAPPIALQGDRVRLAPLGADVGLTHDAGVRGLADPRKRRRLGADRRQFGRRAGGRQKLSDLGLDVAVAALAHAPLHQFTPAGPVWMPRPLSPLPCLHR